MRNKARVTSQDQTSNVCGGHGLKSVVGKITHTKYVDELKLWTKRKSTRKSMGPFSKWTHRLAYSIEATASRSSVSSFKVAFIFSREKASISRPFTIL